MFAQRRQTKAPVSRGPREQISRDATSGPRVRWEGLRSLFDFWGNEIKRFYQLETLASAVEWMIQTNRDRFLLPSIQQVLGPTPVTSLVFELFQEGKYQLIFRLHAANAKRKEATFAFVVAKHHEEYSRVAQAELGNLHVLHQRAPMAVVKPFRGGRVYLPDRHKRVSHGREIYAYVTQWLSGYHELGVNRNLQFFINTKKPHTFTIAQTEQLKARIVETIVRTFDPAKRDCMELPQVASGDFVVTDPIRGGPRIKLIACRRMTPYMTPAKLIHRIVSAKWDWGGRAFRILPVDPGVFFDAIARALDAAAARSWLEQYTKAVKAGRLSEQEVLPLDMVEPFIAR